nr:helix-turn-helix domain-containing protein [Marinomonas pollencensis]
MRALARSNPVAHELLYYLVETMGKTTNAVVVSYATLCEVLQVSRPTAARAVKKLKTDCWVDAVKIGSATAYCVNERVFWQSRQNQRKYAKFSATVIAAGSEQEKEFFDRSKTKLTYIPVIQAGDSVVTGNEKLDPPDQGDLDLT